MFATKRTALYCAILALLFLVPAAHAQVPQTMSYQGVLTDGSGTIVADGQYELLFRLYDQADQGDALWTETHILDVNSGLFHVILGSTIPLDLPFDTQYWLGVTIGTDAELAPRTALTASPYSLGAVPPKVTTLNVGLSDGSSVPGFPQSPILNLVGENGQEDIFHLLADSGGSRLPGFIGARTRGTIAAPEAVGENTFLYAMLFQGYTGTTLATASSIWAHSDGPRTDTSLPGKLTMFTTGRDGQPGGQVTLNSSGNLGIGLGNATDRVEINSFSSSQDAYLRLNTAGGNTYKSGIKMRVFSDEYGFTIRHTDAFPIGLDFLFHSLDEGRTSEEAIEGKSAMFIRRDNGNIGIGNTDPEYKLSVSGAVESLNGGFVFPDGTVQTTALATVGINEFADTFFENISLQPTGKTRGGIFFAYLNDANHFLYNNFNDIDGEGGFDGMKWNTFDGLRIRTGEVGNFSEVLRISGTGLGIRTNQDPAVFLALGDNDTGFNQDGDGRLDVMANNVPQMRVQPDGTLILGNDTAGNVNRERYLDLAIDDSDSGIDVWEDGLINVVANGESVFRATAESAWTLKPTFVAGNSTIGAELGVVPFIDLAVDNPETGLDVGSEDELQVWVDGNVGMWFSPGGNTTLTGNRSAGNSGFTPTIDLSIDDSDTGLDVNEDGMLELYTNNVSRMMITNVGDVGFGIAPSHPIDHANGAHLTGGGVWTNASSRQLKENITELTTEAALLALRGMVPVTYSYKRQPDEQYVGFIAEDVPDLVAMGDRASLSPMDVVAMLTKVVQNQQTTIEDLQRRLEALEAKNR